MTAIAELKNVTKEYDGKKVLDNINLQIKKGEILALIGHNGSGKTTILKILSFLITPTSGELFFQNKIVTPNDLTINRMKSTLVFQKTTFFDTTVYNNIAYGLKIRKMPKETFDTKIQGVLKIVKLEGFEKRNAKTLSGGEQQRIAIARALVLETPLLLLDEPTANLDPKNAAIIEEVIAEVNRRQKTTIVLATHNMFQAKNLPTRIALINDGKISEVGPPTDIFAKLSKELARFAIVENTFAGIANKTCEGTSLVDIGNGVQVEVTDQKQGETSIFISSKDIILSKLNNQSSARNTFKGKIIEITDHATLVKLTIDVGKLFIVQITKKSFNQLGLNLNSEVYLKFKASSVQVF